MKNKKKTAWVFLYIKYSKFLSVSMEHFVECKPLISEEWQNTLKKSRFWKNLFLKSWRENLFLTTTKNTANEVIISRSIFELEKILNFTKKKNYEVARENLKKKASTTKTQTIIHDNLILSVNRHVQCSQCAKKINKIVPQPII